MSVDKLKLPHVSKKALLIGGAFALLIIVTLVMWHKKKQAQEAAAQATQDASNAAAQPTAPYFESGMTGSNVLSDYPGIYGTTGGDAGSDGSVTTGGSGDTNNLSPGISSSSGVDLGNPPDTGGGAPTRSQQIHAAQTVDPGILEDSSLTPTGTVTKQQQQKNTGGLTIATKNKNGSLNIGQFSRTQSSAHPAVSNAPARDVSQHSAGLISKPKAPPPVHYVSDPKRKK